MTREERKEYMEEYYKEYYERTKEKQKEYSRQYRLNNLEKVKQKEKRYYLKIKGKLRKKYLRRDKEKTTEYQREYMKSYWKDYYKKNKEKRKNYMKSYAKTDKGKMCNINQQHKRRVIIKQSDIPSKFLIDLKQNTTHCEICGKKLKDKIDLDHIIPLNIGGTHTRNNVRYVHASCNRQRPKNGSDIIQFKLSL